MTPKEKARQLVDKMSGFTLEDCKFSALVCVDELIESTFSKQKSWNKWKIFPVDNVTTEYWEEVKEEINKL